MNEKELLEELIKSVNRMQTDISEIKDRTLKIEERTSKIEDRTLKIEITLENETNRNIQLLMEAQSLNAEKMKNIDLVLDDIESGVVATEAFVRQNIRDINILKRKPNKKALAYFIGKGFLLMYCRDRKRIFLYVFYGV